MNLSVLPVTRAALCVLIVRPGLCEFADISCGFFGCVLSARGSRAVQILLTVQWRASCGVVKDAFLMWNMLDMMEHLWEMAELEQKMRCVCVHVPTHRG